MKNKMTAFVMLVLCILSICGSIYAQDIPVREEGKISLDSIRFYQDKTGETTSLRQLLEGLTITYASQKKPVFRSSLDISMPGTQLLNYELQSSTPYFVRTNFFGNDTYMIYPEDRFEEKIAEAVYGLINQISDTQPENLPPLEEIYAAIQTIRDAGNGSAAVPGISPVQLTEAVDPTAFLPVMESIMTRIVSADPLREDHYLFTDIQGADLTYSWPDLQKLPSLPVYTNAITAVFTADDLLQLVNCLPEFFEANPEFAQIISASIEQQMRQSDPTLTIPEDIDLLEQVVEVLRETVQNDLADLVLDLRIDMTQAGSVGLLTLVISNDKTGTTQTKLTYHTTADEQNKIHEFASDILSEGNEVPFLRAAAISTQSETGANSFNLFFTDYSQNEFEAVIQADTHINSLNTRFTDTRLRFNYNGEEGDLFVTETGKNGRFDKEETLAEITYEHTSHGSLVFNMSLTAEKKFTEPLPALTPADAVRVSEMTPEDYDTLVSNIFMNFMMLAFSFAN